jgi:hypothetical protein
MNTYCGSRSSRPARLFSFSLLGVLLSRCTRKSNGYPVRLRRPHLREATAGFGLSCLATAFLNNLGLEA